LGADPRFDDDIDGPARHQQVFNIVTADEHQLAPVVEICVLDNFQSPRGPRAEKQC
jgi:hypothetical protein